MALTQLKTGAIADDAVTTDKLADAINTARDANTAKTTNATHTGDVTGSGALTIANDAVTGAKIADDAINSEHYTDGSIDTAHIADSQVTTAKIADDAVTSSKLADSAVVTAAINGGAVTNAKLAADAVTNAKIADDAIDSEHYVDGSIDTAHIADDAVTNAKIAAGAVGGTQLGSNAVSEAKIGANEVTSGKIAAGAIGTAKISDGAVTAAKLASGVGGKILQVIQTIKTDVFSTTASSGSPFDITGLSVNITPASSSNKIFIMADVGGHVHNSQGGAFLIHRSISGGSSGELTTGRADGDGSRRTSHFTGTLYTGDGGGSNDITLTANCKILDSPSTTSAITYKVQMQKNASGDLYCVNRTESDNDSSDEARTVSQITVMEIAA